MEELLLELEAAVVIEMKKRSGLRTSWELMAVPTRVSFLNSLRKGFSEALTTSELFAKESPAGGKTRGKEKQQEQQERTGKVATKVGGPNG